jgi:hypothetical protein
MKRPRLEIGLPEHRSGEPGLHLGHVDHPQGNLPQLLQITGGLDVAAHDLQLQLGFERQPVKRFSHGQRAIAPV